MSGIGTVYINDKPVGKASSFTLDVRRDAIVGSAYGPAYTTYRPNDMSWSFSGLLTVQGAAYFYMMMRKPLKPQRPGPKHYPRRRHGR